MNEKYNVKKDLRNNIKEIQLLGEGIRREIKSIADGRIEDLGYESDKKCENIINKGNQNQVLIDAIEDAVKYNQLDLVENLLKKITSA